MKKIGIVGGAGPESSALLYNKIIRLYQTKYGAWQDNDFPFINILSYPFNFDSLDQNNPSQSKKLIYELQKAIDYLQNAHVDVIAIACNTLHTLIPYIHIKTHFINLIDITLMKSQEKKLKRLLFLGTTISKEGNLYVHNKRQDIAYPSVSQQKLVMSVIFNALKGVYSIQDKKTLEQVIRDCSKNDMFDGVVLGCTDLSIINSAFPLNIPGIIILDTIDILAQHLCELI